MQTEFQVVAQYEPSGDQPQAIAQLAKHFTGQNNKKATLLGVTGSGKTFTMAKVIEQVKRPTLVLSHNKTLCAQLYRELKDFFPHNAVEYFVSYYDYYQPEAYVPVSDMYIEKDASINDEIERLRLRATSALLEQEDVIIVASVSCIYGLGSPEDYAHLMIRLQVGDAVDRDTVLRRLVDIQYERNQMNFLRGSFRVFGDRVDIYPAYLQQEAIRIEFFSESVESISRFNPITGEILNPMDRVAIYPAKHFVITHPRIQEALVHIEQEMLEQVKFFQSQNKNIEAQRIESRTRFDMEMLKEMGYCNGIENYSRHLSGRPAGSSPATLFEYFPDDFLLIIDESHVTLPQVRGMYEGDRSRKQTLVDFGFRLPSALDNRPLFFSEFEKKMDKALFVSATPSQYELDASGLIAEQLIRPTGLVDPKIEIRPVQGQIEDLIKEVRKRAKLNERVLVTTLTKKFAENLTEYLTEADLRVRYLHSEIETLERVEILRDLRKGEFDCLVGINLLREGLDLPEVSLVAILDADKEGFLRDTRSLIQTAGRAARNVNGLVIFYAERITSSMQAAIDETERRRAKQIAHNQAHGITPQTIIKGIQEIIEREHLEETGSHELIAAIRAQFAEPLNNDLAAYQLKLQEEMHAKAAAFAFEEAAILRDELLLIKGDKSFSGKKQKKIQRRRFK